MVLQWSSQTCADVPRSRKLTGCVVRSGLEMWICSIQRTVPKSTIMNTPMRPVSAEVVRSLAPAGTLRAALSLANPVLVQLDPATGVPSGISVDLAQALAHRLGVPLQTVAIDHPAKCFEAVKTAACDIGFLAIEASRTADIDFTAPYILIEGVYAVPEQGPLKANSDVDRAGVRVAVKKGTAYELFLARSLRAAILHPAADPFDLFERDGLEAIAGVRQAVSGFAAMRPGVHVLPGRFMEIPHAMCLPKGRDTGAAYLRAFVEEMKASQFVAAAIRRAGQDATVAGPA
jgi:polar amino acid transport system substrate-binding protein